MGATEIFLYISETLASLLTFISFIPQVLEIRKSRSTSGTSLKTFVLFTVEYFLWILWGALLAKDAGWDVSAGLVICDGFGMLLSFYIVTLKITNIKKAKQMDMTEKEYERWREKRKLAKNRMKKIGAFSNEEIKVSLENRKMIIAVIRKLSKFHPDIVKIAIQKNKSYEKIVVRPKTFNGILDKFISVASNYDLLDVLEFVYRRIERTK